MTSDREDEERVDRDRDRSEEAHWQVAEAGAEKAEEPLKEAGRQSDNQQTEWEDEGGALSRDP